MVFYPFSDAPLNNLEPLESVSFDVTKLDTISGPLLQDLMTLTFLSDEKKYCNPLFPEKKLKKKQKPSEPGTQINIKQYFWQRSCYWWN